MGVCEGMSYGFLAQVVSFTQGVTNSGSWEPGIGDPTVMGWVTVAAYFVTMALCMFMCFFSWRDWGHGEALNAFLFWAFLSAFTLFLGINKQLDLQTFFTELAKDVAKEQGWYQQRHTLQAAFVASVGAIGMTCFIALGWLMRRAPGIYAVALAGAAFLLCFVFVRAASIHHVDEFLKSDIGGAKMNWILELGGILGVGVAAFWARRGQEVTPE